MTKTQIKDTVRTMLADWQRATPAARAVTAAIAAGLALARMDKAFAADDDEGRTAFAVGFARSKRKEYAEREGATLKAYDAMLHNGYGYKYR
jgi:hypothetical protein